MVAGVVLVLDADNSVVGAGRGGAVENNFELHGRAGFAFDCLIGSCNAVAILDIYSAGGGFATAFKPYGSICIIPAGSVAFTALSVADHIRPPRTVRLQRYERCRLLVGKHFQIHIERAGFIGCSVDAFGVYNAAYLLDFNIFTVLIVFLVVSCHHCAVGECHRKFDLSLAAVCHIGVIAGVAGL